MEELKLYDWQKEAISICKEKEAYALFATMGTGKTCCVIQVLRNICNKEKRHHRTLILGPVAVVFNWQKELLKFSNFKENIIFVSVGTGANRSRKLQSFLDKNPDSIVITNYESLRNQSLYVTIKKWKPEIGIFDEIHRCKEQKSQQSKLVYNLAKSMRYRYILTGTPILQSALDIFQQYKIMDLGRTFGANFFGFRARYFINENANKSWMNFPKWVPNESMYPELTEKMHASCIRVKREECLDLPERIEQTYYVELSPPQKKIYKDMRKDFIAYINGEEVVADLALTKALRLQQILTGFAVSHKGAVLEIPNIPRVKAVKELLEQITLTDKCILWASWVFNYSQLGKVCDELGLEYVKISGAENAREKQDAVDRFQDPKGPKVAICNRRAAGLGINLTQAAYSIVYSRNFSAEEQEQSKARNYRGGSEIHKKIVAIDLCARGTIDEVVIEALKNKQKISDVLLDKCVEL